MPQPAKKKVTSMQKPTPAPTPQMVINKGSSELAIERPRLMFYPTRDLADRIDKARKATARPGMNAPSLSNWVVNACVDKLERDGF